MTESIRVGVGYDLHCLVSGRPLLLGTVRIESPVGLFGHSDGDVLAHAIADALLGAAGIGEIGGLFPNDDPEVAGIAGARILAETAARIAAAGWTIGNVNAVVIAEKPRLAPHRDAMIDGLAAALSCARDRVSIQIKSNEGIDAIGRGEAIAAHAVACLLRI